MSISISIKSTASERIPLKVMKIAANVIVSHLANKQGHKKQQKQLL